MKAKKLGVYSIFICILNVTYGLAASNPSPAQVKDELTDILNNWEFSRYEQGDSLQKLLIKLLSWLGFKESAVGNFEVGQWAITIAIIIIGLILIWYLLRHILPFWNILTPDVAKVEAEAEAGVPLVPISLFRKAQEMAQEQDFREALRFLYLALLLELDEKRVISYQNAKTNYEYLKEVNSKASHLRDKFGDLMNLFEHKWYGLEDCTSEDYHSGLLIYQAITKEGT